MRNLIKLGAVIFFFLSAICYLPSAIYCEIPHLINYQGKLTDKTGLPLEGSQAVTFRIYDEPGTLLWEEQQTITLQKGLFNTMLGSVKNLNLTFDQPYYLEIKVGNEVLGPRQRITSAGYAFRAEKATESVSAISAGNADKLDNYDTSTMASANKIPVMDANGYLPAGSVNGNVLTAALGSPVSKSINTVYQANTDGFVIAYSNTYGSHGYMNGYADTSSSPSTIRVHQEGQADEHPMNLCVTFPVKKGEYWKIVVGENTTSATITWMPLGS
jgi:hypothetical protein